MNNSRYCLDIGVANNASKKIAIVDDNNELSEMYCDALEIENYQCLSFRSGHEFLTYLEDQEMPAVVICDLLMPEMMGAELVGALKSEANFSSIRILLSSGAGDLRKQAHDLGVAGIIPKPSSLDTLISTVNKQF